MAADAASERGAARRRLPRRALRAALWMAAGAVAALSVVGAAALVALPALEQRPEIAAGWLSEQLGRPVRLAQVELAWRGAGPVVRLRGLEIGAHGADGLVFDTAEVRVDALGSVRSRSLQPRSVTVRGAQLSLSRDADGSMAIAGFGSGGAARAEEAIALALASLPAGAVLALEDARVTLPSFAPPSSAGAAAVVLEPVSLELRTVRDGLRLAGTLASPASPSTPVRFTLRWRDPAASPLAAAELTLSARDLPLAALPPGLLPAGLAARLHLDLQGSFAGGALEAFRGTVELRRPTLAAAPGAIRADALQALLDFSRAPAADARDVDWRLAVLRLQARGGGQLSPPSNLTVDRIVVAREHASQRATDRALRVTLDQAPLSGLLPLLPRLGLPDAVADTAGRWLTPSGRIEDLVLVLSGEPRAPRLREARAALFDLVAQAPSGGLRLGPANVRLVARGEAGRIDVAPFPALAADAGEPLAVTVGGALRWHRSGDGLTLEWPDLQLVADEARVSASGSVELPADPARAPRLSLDLHGGGFDVPDLVRRLAVHAPDTAVGSWLRGALPAGRVDALRARLAGTPAELAALAGDVHVSARVDALELRYDDGWPALEALGGEIALDGRRLAFRVERGRVSGAQIDDARGTLDDVLADGGTLSVTGRASGLTEQGTAFLAATPAGARFTGLLAQLDARGAASFAMELAIPVGAAEHDARVSGTVALAGNTLRVPALRSALEAVDGRIRFDENGLRDGDLEARYLERRITARVEGHGDGRADTRLTIDGATDPAGLVRHLYDVGALDRQDPEALPLLSRLHGTSRWQVLLGIPHRDDADGQDMTLMVRSDLEGMALDLPAPLGKPAAGRRRLEVSTRIDDAGPRRFQLRYGAHSARLDMAPADGGGFRLSRGVLRFGGEAPAPREPGLEVEGEVALLSVDGWVDVIAELSQAGAAVDAPLAVLRSVDVTAGRLVTLGAAFTGVRVQVSHPSGGDWQVAVSGAGVDGRIDVPVPVGTRPIDARFEVLDLERNPVAPEGGPSLDPRTLPGARIVVQRLRFGAIDLGLSKMTVRQTADGVEISELFALNDAFELRGAGTWTVRDGEARSTLGLRIHSGDFGRMTAMLGYGDSGIEGGVTDIALDTDWNGSPFDFGLERVHGALHFRATGGRLLDVEPGATGRVFGLLNVGVLPRRLLQLDFNDLFEEGVSYDLVEGSFRLESGNAWSENLSMHTQNARVDLVGRVGLVDEDYDQVMTVTPKLSASLPLAPIWLAEQFLKRKLIDGAFAYRYIITGPWDDPKVERVKVEAVPTDAG